VKTPIPSTWPKHVKTGILHTISLARMVFSAARGHANRSKKTGVRLSSDLAQAHREIALLEEEIRLKDLRMERVPVRHRPYYRPIERLAILELRAARGWSRGTSQDKGSQFDCAAFRSCREQGMRVRYASAGSLRATAIVERFIRSLKDE
jgi:hypothetical protein